MNNTRSLKTVLVDDEPFVRADLRYMLSRYRQVEVVWETGIFEEAKKILIESPLDMVFLDIQLRGGNGFDLIPYINPGITNLIIVSAHEKYREQSLKTIALGFILKPVTPEGIALAMDQISY